MTGSSTPIIAASLVLGLAAPAAQGQPATPASDAPAAKEDLERRELWLMRKQAEDLEQAGEYEDCGKAYGAIYAQSPDAARSDEVLYNAGVCYEQAKLLGAALRSYALLQQRHPRSVLAQKALIRSANGYRSIAFFEEAAEHYERYARRYGGEKDAPGALLSAIEFRRALGHASQAKQLSQLYVKLYARKQDLIAAQVAYRAIDADEGDPRKTIRQLESFLKRWARTPERGLLLLASARLGALLWTQSCVEGSDSSGACVRRTRVISEQRCGAGYLVRVLRRDHRMVGRAQVALRRAVAIRAALAKQSRPTSGRARFAAEVERAYAKALFHLAEPQYEAYLALGYPDELDFDPRHRKKYAASRKRAAKWLEDKSALYTKLVGSRGVGQPGIGSYGLILSLGDSAGPWANAAAARIGQVSLRFYEDLVTAEVPRAVREGSAGAVGEVAYCSALRRHGEPVEEMALADLRSCAARAGPGQMHLRWSALCRRELERWRPVEFPAAREIAAWPEPTTSVTDLEVLAPYGS